MTPVEAPVSDDYVLRTWEMDDGLPNNSVWGIAQTPDGYLWIVTSAGLARFDGVRFTLFDRGVAAGLGATRVRTAFVARDGHLWLGLERGGVARRVGDRFETIVPPAARPTDLKWTSSVAEDRDGAIWFGVNSERKVFRWRDGTLTEFTGRDGIGPGGETEVCADAEGRIWATTTHACAVFDGKRFRQVGPSDARWPRITPARTGGMWVVRAGSVMRYHADGRIDAVVELGNIDVKALLEDREGTLWVGTDASGLLRYRDGACVRVPTSHSSVWAVFEDREGNLWAGTVGGGLNRVHLSRFGLRQKQHGLRSEGIVSVCEDAEGRIWLAGRDGPPRRAVDATNRTFAVLPGWSSMPVMALCPEPTGGVWLGSLSGLQRWRDGAFSGVLLKEAVTALMVDRRGDLWVATIKDRLVRWREGKPEAVAAEEGLTQPRALAEDAAGRVWVGTEAGLVFRRDREAFASVPLPGPIPPQQIRFIVPDENDTVWIGAFESGLYRWRAGRVQALPANAGLPTEDLRALVLDAEGNAWIGTGRGMFRVARHELEEAIDGRRRVMRVVAYGRDDGLPNVDYIFGFKSTALRARDGHLWFATTRGALEIGPPTLPDRPAPAALLIEYARLGEDEVPVSGGETLVLPPRPAPLHLGYTLPELRAPEQVRFRYRLVGSSDEWIPADRQRAAVFAHLPAGSYRFEVTAAEADGPWLPPASLAFTVRAAWWETVWFRVALGLGVAVALAFTVRLLVRRRMRARLLRLEQENALERERTRIARDIHDELGANITQIMAVGELARLEPPATAPAHIAEMVAIARGTVASLDEIVWAVNPRYDTVAALVEYLGKFTLEFLTPAGLACDVELPAEPPARELESTVRHHLFVVVKETLNNIVKHAHARRVQLFAEATPELLRLTIRDDGCGFVVGSEPADANGLRNLRERMQEAGGTYGVESRLGEGTCVTLELPLA